MNLCGGEVCKIEFLDHFVLLTILLAFVGFFILFFFVFLSPVIFFDVMIIVLFDFVDVAVK